MGFIKLSAGQASRSESLVTESAENIERVFALGILRSFKAWFV
jgi:hypothetical protein